MSPRGPTLFHPLETEEDPLPRLMVLTLLLSEAHSLSLTLYTSCASIQCLTQRRLCTVAMDSQGVALVEAGKELTFPK